MNSMDTACQRLIAKAEKEGKELVWDRMEAQQPACGFGELGTCCRICLQGPCRIDPFQEGPQRGVCGATADTMVARNLLRSIAGGAAAHSGHAKHLAHTLLKVARGVAPDYAVQDEQKLLAVAKQVGLNTEGKDIRQVALELAELALAEFSEKDTPSVWAASTVTKGRVDTFVRLGVVPTGIDSAISEVMHRTSYGVDADPVNLLLGGIKCALADYAGCHLATDLADILFGVPHLVTSKANLGVLKERAVNVALHGHNPLLSDVMVQVASEFAQEAKSAGAPEGINVVGICCTGNEVLMRRGIPSATHSVSQELAIVTGVLDAVVADYQCVMPSLAHLAECYHTKVITTMPLAKIPGATHVEFREENAKEAARQIIRLALEAYGKRDPRKVSIPPYESTVVAGFSTETIIGALAKLDPGDPLKPLVDNVAAGNILGVCLLAGCNNATVTQDSGFLTIARELARNNVLLLATGCGAGSLARHGFLTPEATQEYAGEGLKAVLTAVGEAAGLGGPLPLVLHMGSCVDNSRAVDVAVALADKLGTDVDKLPIAASAPEATTEKAIAIGTWAVAAGLPVHVGVVPPVLGGSLVARLLTEKVKELTGGYFLVETDPSKAAEKLLAAIKERRQALGI